MLFFISVSDTNASKGCANSTRYYGEQICFHPTLGGIVRLLLQSEAWNELDSRTAQLVFLDAFAWIDCFVLLDSGHLAGVFDLTRDRVGKVFTKSTKSSRPPQHPLILIPDVRTLVK
jgi:hypothetical protein